MCACGALTLNSAARGLLALSREVVSRRSGSLPDGAGFLSALLLRSHISENFLALVPGPAEFRTQRCRLPTG